MPSTKITRELPYPPEDLYAIAADVASYSAFLPLCTFSTFDITSSENGIVTGRGELGIKKPEYGIDQTFVSDVACDPKTLTVVSTSSEAPVKSLYSKWSFTPRAGGGSRVEYEVDFEFRNLALRLLMAKFFGVVVDKMITAFEARARELHETELRKQR